MYKIILKIILIISLLLNSAGQGYALRPLSMRLSIFSHMGIHPNRIKEIFLSPQYKTKEFFKAIVDELGLKGKTGVEVDTGTCTFECLSLLDAGMSQMTMVDDKKLPKQNDLNNARIMLKEADANKLPFGPNSFDLALFDDSLEEIAIGLKSFSIKPHKGFQGMDATPQEFEETIAKPIHEARKVIKDNGYVVIYNEIDSFDNNKAKIEIIKKQLIEQDFIIILTAINTTCHGHGPSLIIAQRLSLPEKSVIITDLSTKESRIIKRKEFIGRLSLSEFAGMEITDRLNAAGSLYLGDRYGEKYIPCVFTNHRNGIVRYQIRENVVSNIVLLSDKFSALEAHKLSIARDYFGKALDSFLFTNKLPKRIRSLIGKCKIAFLAGLVVGEGNKLQLSPEEVYGFESKGDFSGKEVMVHYEKGAIIPKFFLVGAGSQAVNIPADEARIKPGKKRTSVFQSRRDSQEAEDFKREPAETEPEIPRDERLEIRERVRAALNELPMDKKVLASSILDNIILFHDKKGATRIKQLAKYLNVAQKQILEILELLKQTEAFKGIHGEYTVAGAFFRKPRKLRSRYDTPPLPALEDGDVYIWNRKTRKLNIIKRKDLETKYKEGKLGNVEVIYDRLDNRGALSFYRVDGVDGKEIFICTYSTYPGRRIRYYIKDGRADPTTVVLLDEEEEPLQDGKISYVEDDKTGEIRCHLPEKNIAKLFKKLKNVTVYDRLSQNGQLYTGKECICTYGNYPNSRIKYKVKNGKPDKATIILLEEDGSIRKDTKLRYAVDSADEIICHLPGSLQGNLLALLEGKAIYDRLSPESGNLTSGHTKDRETNMKCVYANHAGRRIKYKIRNAMADRTTLLLLNEDGSILGDPDVRCAKDIKTGTLMCHLPDFLSKELIKDLGDCQIYDRLSRGKGVLTLRGSEPSVPRVATCVFKKHPASRITYQFRKGKLDRTTMILLNEDGSVLIDDKTRYAVDIKTGKLKCHLPESLQENLYKLLNNVIIYDKLTSQGTLFSPMQVIGEPRRKKENYTICKYSSHPSKKIRYKVYRGKIDMASISLLNYDNSPLQDDKTRYAVNVSTGEVKCHLQEVVSTAFLKRLGDVEVVNDRLAKSDGSLMLGGKRMYRSAKHAGGMVRYRLRDNKLISIALLSEEGRTIQEEVFDQEVIFMQTPKQMDVECIKIPSGQHIITYQTFIERFYSNHIDGLQHKSGLDHVKKTLRKRLYYLLHPNVFFFFSDRFEEEAHLALKSEVFLLWKDLAILDADKLTERLVSLTQIFARYAQENIGQTIIKAKDLPGKFRVEVCRYGVKINTILTKSKSVRKASITRLKIDSAA